MRIELLKRRGNFSVYRRMWREPGLRRYFVLRESDGKILEDFRRLRSAVAWATAREKEEGKA